MHVLFVHQNYPAQFGHIADHLVRRHGFRCTFVSQRPAARDGQFERVTYTVRGGATDKSHYCSRTFENAIWHTHAVYEALAARPDIQPDLIVGHSGFGSTLFLRDLYRCPIINYFEYFYRPVNSDMDFRPDFPCLPIDRARARARNATILLDLENADAGYSPTQWQRSRLPNAFQSKIESIFDGIDLTLWRHYDDVPRLLGSEIISSTTKVITYVARGMESMRGFDLFMRVAKRICDQRPDVIFAVVGDDRICYGGDARVINGSSMKTWVLSQDRYDLSRIKFLGTLTPAELARLWSITDLHLYWTVPFVLSWSLMNAMACGKAVVASDTEPVREMIRPGENGELIDFFDLDRWTLAINELLDDPGRRVKLGDAAARHVRSQYSLDVCLPKMLSLYQKVTSGYFDSANNR